MPSLNNGADKRAKSNSYAGASSPLPSFFPESRTNVWNPIPQSSAIYSSGISSFRVNKFPPSGCNNGIYTPNPSPFQSPICSTHTPSSHLNIPCCNYNDQSSGVHAQAPHYVSNCYSCHVAQYNQSYQPQLCHPFTYPENGEATERQHVPIEKPNSEIMEKQQPAVIEVQHHNSYQIYGASPCLTELTLNQFEVFNTLGTGTFGRVYLCRFRQHFSPSFGMPDIVRAIPPPNVFFALKMMSKREILRLKQLEHVFSEKAILYSCTHPFIIKLYSTFQNPRYLFMLLEFGAGGELFSYLKKYGRFSLAVTKFYAAELVLALEYLHSKDIVFRDLKPENLLLDAQGHIKIADFGTWTLCGTPEYLAPEIIQGQGHSKEVDWWALGILIYEMLVGFPPFYDSNPFQIYEKILAGHIAFPDWVDFESRSVICQLLNPDRRERLGSSLSSKGTLDVKKHPWFCNIDWNALYSRKIQPPIRPFISFAGDSNNFERYPEIRPEPIPIWEVDPYQHLFEGF